MNYSPDCLKKYSISSNSVNMSGRLALLKQGFVEPDGLVSRLNLVASAKESATVSAAHVLVMGFDNRDSLDLVHLLWAVGVKLCATCSTVEHMNSPSADYSRFDHIIVNADAFEDVDEAVTALMIFRKKNKKIIVVLVSVAVGKDDLSSERKFICDVTIRSPVSFDRLRDAICSASANNDAFNK